MIVGYCRVGILEPASSLSAQKAALAAAGAQVFFTERVGVNGRSPELERAIASVQSGDTLMVTRPYRVARSTRGVLALIDRLGRRGAGFRILGTPVDTSTTTGRMILGSTPLWSLNMSPARAALRDLVLGWRGAPRH
jgi:DNA invertase Pin-like site-specific DNA recombinase